MRRGALRGDRSTGIGGVVPLPKLSEGAPAVVRSGRRLGTRSKSNTVARVAEHRYVASEEPLRLQPPGYWLTALIPGWCPSSNVTALDAAIAPAAPVPYA
jgi:hypothetical protein